MPAPTPADDRRPSLDELTTEVEQALREGGHRGVLERDVVNRRLVLGPDAWLSLEHIYEQLAGHPRDRRRQLLERMAAQVVHPAKLPPTWAEAGPLVRMVVKPKAAHVVDQLRREAGVGPAAVWAADLSEHLVIELAVPCPGGSLSVPKETLAGWGATAEDAFRTAIQSDAADGGRLWLTSPENPGVLRSPWRDGRDPGRLLLPPIFARLPVKGRPVAMLPTPSMLLVAGSEDEQGLLAMARLAKRTIEGSGLIYATRTLLMAEDGGSWIDWLPPRGHPARDTVRLVQAMGEVHDYAAVVDAEDILARAKAAEPIVRPRLQAVRSAHTGETLTVTTWRSGKPVALPKADAIVLRQGAKTLGLVAWDDVEVALPGLLRRLPGYPPRFIATDFPEPWHLGALDVRPWSEPRDS